MVAGAVAALVFFGVKSGYHSTRLTSKIDINVVSAHTLSNKSTDRPTKVE